IACAERGSGEEEGLALLDEFTLIELQARDDRRRVRGYDDVEASGGGAASEHQRDFGSDLRFDFARGHCSAAFLIGLPIVIERACGDVVAPWRQNKKRVGRKALTLPGSERHQRYGLLIDHDSALTNLDCDGCDSKARIDVEVHF